MARTPDPDDAALRWDELDDASYLESDLAATSVAAEVADDVAAVPGGATGAPPPARGRAASGLVTAVAALIYLAYSIAWVIGVGQLPLSGPTLLLEVLYQFAEFLAIIASALWFGATIVLTRGRLVARAGWLALGALVLLPWPFVFGVIA